MSNQAVFLGSGLLHQATVTLTDAQIKASGEELIDILPAPGENLMYVLMSAALILDTRGGAYTGVSPDAAFLLSAGTQQPILGVSRNALESTTVSYIVMPPAGLVAFFGSAFEERTTKELRPASSWVNQALLLSDWIGPGAYGGGNAANSMVVSVAYLLFNTATGQFV